MVEASRSAKLSIVLLQNGGPWTHEVHCDVLLEFASGLPCRHGTTL